MSRIILQPIGKNITGNAFIEAENTSWGQKEKYRDIWENSIGDTILFIKNRIIIAIAKIKDIEENYEINIDYPLRYIWNEDIEYINIPLEEINKIVGYKLNFSPQKHQLIQKDNYLIDKVFNFLDKFKTIIECKNIENKKELTETEIETLIKLRIGQSKYREELINYWNGCSVTGYENKGLLIASHIKPWKDSSNMEKLDVYNGLLLIPNLDKLFDRGYISFNDNGTILISEQLKDIEILGLNKKMKIDIENEHKNYLEYHRKNIFK